MNTASKSGAINIWGLPTLHNNNTFASTDGGNGQSKQTNCNALVSLYSKLKTAYASADSKAKKEEYKAQIIVILKQMKLDGCATGNQIHSTHAANFNGEKCNCGCGKCNDSQSFTGTINEPIPTNAYYSVNTGAFTGTESITNAFTVPTINAFSNPNNQMPAVTNLPPAILPACVPNTFGVSDYTMPNVTPATPVPSVVKPACVHLKKRPTFLQWLFNGMKA